tara:strand:- start:11 stop:199 length:189 start_codon:yes stop_codon:yes gene_type:complete
MSKSYYLAYYDQKKHLYKQRYLEKKRQKEDDEELYRPYGGERAYYRMKILEFCNVKKIEMLF